MKIVSNNVLTFDIEISNFGKEVLYAAPFDLVSEQKLNFDGDSYAVEMKKLYDDVILFHSQLLVIGISLTVHSVSGKKQKNQFMVRERGIFFT